MATQDITVSERVYELIRSDIVSGTLAAGEKLTIKKLHERYDVSSSPIREALFRLQQDGLIEYRSNAGMRVVEFTRNDITEIFMLLTEFDVIAMKAAMATTRKIGTLVALERCMQRSEEALDTDEWNQYSDEFHSIFYREAGNGRLTDAARKIRIQSTQISNRYESDPDNRRDILRQHGELLAALKSDNLDAAEKVMRSHMASSYIKALDTLQE